jgi:hypothetical protein
VLEMRRRPAAARAQPLLLAKDRKESACHIAAYPLGFERMANGAAPPPHRARRAASGVWRVLHALCAVRRVSRPAVCVLGSMPGVCPAACRVHMRCGMFTAACRACDFQRETCGVYTRPLQTP